MAIIDRTSIVASLEYGARANFLNGMKSYTPKRAAFVDETPSSGAFEVYEDLGAAPWPSHNGGQTPGTATDSRTGAPQVGGLGGGDQITVLGAAERALVVYSRTWEIATAITHEAIDDNRTGGLEDWNMRAGVNFQRHMDYLAFQALAGGTGTTFGKCYNGLSFFNDSHIDPNAQYQTAQDNNYALALSLDNFETVYVAGHSLLDDRGKPAGNVLNLLIHSVNLLRTAGQITDNREDYGTGNRAVNPYAGAIARLEAPAGAFSTTNWFLVSTLPGQKPLGLQIREMPQLVAWDDHNTTPSVRYYKWTARYEVFYRDWRSAVKGNA